MIFLRNSTNCAELPALLTNYVALIVFILFILFAEQGAYHGLLFYSTVLQVYHTFRSRSSAKNLESPSFRIHLHVALLIFSIFICLETLPSIQIYDNCRVSAHSGHVFFYCELLVFFVLELITHLAFDS